jgi:hypothetical protein
MREKEISFKIVSVCIYEENDFCFAIDILKDHIE